MTFDVSDEILCAYIDNELDPAERASLLDQIATDAELRARACELWQVKQMVRGAYPAPQGKATPNPAHRTPSRWPHALAASLLLVAGTLAGWIAHGRADEERLMTSQIDAIRSDGGRVVLHLFSDEPERMEAALRTAEQLATARDRNGRPFRVEFLANGPGLHLLRTGGSPYADRIAILREHANLRLIACHQAMERLRERGIDVTLLPGVEEALSAESQLATRLTQGWRYIQS
jgi:intracellular sulfur oxidation DsrE/DsrF family protein